MTDPIVASSNRPRNEGSSATCVTSTTEEAITRSLEIAYTHYAVAKLMLEHDIGVLHIPELIANQTSAIIACLHRLDPKEGQSEDDLKSELASDPQVAGIVEGHVAKQNVSLVKQLWGTRSSLEEEHASGFDAARARAQELGAKDEYITSMSRIFAQVSRVAPRHSLALRTNERILGRLIDVEPSLEKVGAAIKAELPTKDAFIRHRLALIAGSSRHISRCAEHIRELTAPETLGANDADQARELRELASTLAPTLLDAAKPIRRFQLQYIAEEADLFYGKDSAA